METQRPEGFENECRDCTVIALSLASNLPYLQVHSAWKEVGRKDGHKIKSRKFLQRVCKILNVTAKQVKRHGSLRGFINKFPQGNYYCTERGHAFAVIEGVSHGEDNLNNHIKGAWLITKQMEVLK